MLPSTLKSKIPGVPLHGRQFLLTHFFSILANVPKYDQTMLKYVSVDLEKNRSYFDLWLQNTHMLSG